jgi:hypothetical protein
VSVKLVYEQVKDILGQQKLTAQILDVKTIAVWAGITTIVGIALPLGFSRVTRGTLPLVHLSIVPIVLYIGVLYIPDGHTCEFMAATFAPFAG